MHSSKILLDRRAHLNAYTQKIWICGRCVLNLVARWCQIHLYTPFFIPTVTAFVQRRMRTHGYLSILNSRPAHPIIHIYIFNFVLLSLLFFSRSRLKWNCVLCIPLQLVCMRVREWQGMTVLRHTHTSHADKISMMLYNDDDHRHYFDVSVLARMQPMRRKTVRQWKILLMIIYECGMRERGLYRFRLQTLISTFQTEPCWLCSCIHTVPAHRKGL